MPFKKDALPLTSIFVIIMIFLVLGGYYLFQRWFVLGAILMGSIIPLFILMVLKGRSMKEEYPKEYDDTRN